MSAGDEVKEIVKDLTGMWWPEADVGDLQEAARAWRTFADEVLDCTAAANKAAGRVTSGNQGEAVEAFDEFWRRYYHGGQGWLQDVADGARDMAKALDKYADQIAEAKKKIEHELEIAGAVIVAGTALALFTGGITEAAAGIATEAVLAAAGSASVAVSTTVAEIAGTVLASAAMGGMESIAVDVVVAQGGHIALGDQQGLNLQELREAGLSGALLGGALGGTVRGAEAVKDVGGIRNILPDLSLSGPRLALAGSEMPVGPTGNALLRQADSASSSVAEPQDYAARHPIGHRGRQEDTSIRSPEADDKGPHKGNREVKVVIPKDATAKNAPTVIEGRPYGGHALDRMQERGIMPSVVEDTVKNGEAVPGKRPGTMAYYNHTEGITIITDAETGRVVTVAGGIIKQ